MRAPNRPTIPTKAGTGSRSRRSVQFGSSSRQERRCSTGTPAVSLRTPDPATTPPRFGGIETVKRCVAAGLQAGFRLSPSPHQCDHCSSLIIPNGCGMTQRDPWAAVFVDVLGSDESTARALVGEEMLCRPRQVLLCGSGSLALAFLQEFARGSWEDAELDLRAEGILREFTENTPQAMLVCAPDVIRLPGSWQERLLRSLDQVTGWSRM